MYNPWNKYLNNANNLFEKTDSYYLIIYTEDESYISNLEFSTKEETITINSELKGNEFMTTSSKSQNYLIKSSNKENQIIFVQISPIINFKNNITSENDEFEAISQFKNQNQKGKIFPKINRTYALIDDPLIDSYISFNLNQENQYEIKYSYISNKVNFKKDRITWNYTIELENNTYSINFKPLFKNKNIIYNIFIFYNEIKDNISPSYLYQLTKNNESPNSISIIKKEINTNNDTIKILLDNNDIDRIKKENCYITVLAQENQIYNIIMNYDIVINNATKSRTGLIIGIIFGSLAFIALILVLGYFAYKYFLKKKVKSEEELIKHINSVDVNIGEENKEKLNNENDENNNSNENHDEGI